MEITFKNSTFIVFSVLFVFWTSLVFCELDPHINAAIFFFTFPLGVLVATWTKERHWRNKWLDKYTTLF